jgi:hypothetical protein
MQQDDTPRHTPDTNEPNYLPNQAEGDTQSEAPTEHLRTPGQAEGEREAIEETLAHQPEQGRDAEPSRSLWERVKALFS